VKTLDIRDGITYVRGGREIFKVNWINGHPELGERWDLGTVSAAKRKSRTLTEAGEKVQLLKKPKAA
jgi:hypothetical protein